MKTAPPIALDVPPLRGWAFLEGVLAGIATTVLLAWALAHLERPPWLALAAGLAVALVLARRPLPGSVRLAWDGVRWTLDGHAAQLAVQIDAGPLLLLRTRVPGTGRVHWLPVTAGAVGPAWHPLRAALYSRPPEATPGDAPPERGPHVPPH